MGASGSSPSHCLVRNQLGRDVRILCGRASASAPRNGGPVPEPGCRDEIVAHGSEQRLEVPFHDPKGLVLGVRLGDGDVRALVVPNGATLVIRTSAGLRGARNGTPQGEPVLRISRPGAEGSEAPALVDASAFVAVLQGDSLTSSGPEFAPPGSSATPRPTQAQASAATSHDSKRARVHRAATDGLRDASHGGSDEGPLPGPVDVSTATIEMIGAGSAGESVPCELACPISHELFADPVLASDGFTYERACIEEWWQRRGARSPMTGREVTNTVLTPNLAIRTLANEYRSNCSEIPEDADTSSARGTAVQRASHDSESARGLQDTPAAFAGFYERHVPALQDMFLQLSEVEIRDVCCALAAEGVEDIDACVRSLLRRSAAEGGEAIVVSQSPVCCASGLRDADVAVSAALLEPSTMIPDSWTPAQEALFVELLDIPLPAVRARKAIDLGQAEDLDDAILWIERHQDDDDIDTPMEVLLERDNVQLALDVLRVATVPAVYRLQCLRSVHQVLGNILADPASERLRKIRVQNEKFKERIGRFPQAVALLRRIGFVKGDFWVSAYQREPCLEFKYPVDSDNPASQRFVRTYSLIDEVLRNPDDWLPSSVGEALPPVQSEWAKATEEVTADATTPTGLPATATPAARGSAVPVPSREYRADLHERRVRDPRGFQEAMLAAGKRANRTVVNVQARDPEAAAASKARDLAACSSAGSSGAAPAYRRLRERYPGKHEFDLKDIENMRVEDAIAGCPRYAQDYENSQSQAASYSQLVSRMYDPRYLGRKAVDDTNIFRGQQRAPPLRWSQALADIAEVHAQQMAKGQMPFSHLDFDKRVAQYPFPHKSAAENLAYNLGVADAAGCAVQGWIKSPGHRKNLLGAYDLCGVGVARSSTGKFYFTQLFARTYGALC